MAEISGETYERAIHAKDQVIRELTRENRRLKAEIERLAQLQIAELQDRGRMVEALREQSPN